jgi:hypothetical protein
MSINTLVGRFGGFAGVSSEFYLGAATYSSNTTINVPPVARFAVFKIFGGRGSTAFGNSRTDGGYTAIKLDLSGGETLYATVNGSRTSTFIDAGSDYGGGYSAISTSPLAPGNPEATTIGYIIGLSGGSGGHQPQSFFEAGGDAGFPAGANGQPPSFTGNGGTQFGGGAGGGNNYPPGGPGPGPGSYDGTPGGFLAAGRGGFGGNVPSSGSGGGGGAGLYGGGGGGALADNGGRGYQGGGGSNYIAPSHPLISAISNSAFSQTYGYDTSDPDYPNALTYISPAGSVSPTETGGVIFAKFFTAPTTNYDSPEYSLSTPLVEI